MRNANYIMLESLCHSAAMYAEVCLRLVVYILICLWSEIALRLPVPCHMATFPCSSRFCKLYVVSSAWDAVRPIVSCRDTVLIVLNHGQLLRPLPQHSRCYPKLCSGVAPTCQPAVSRYLYRMDAALGELKQEAGEVPLSIVAHSVRVPYKLRVAQLANSNSIQFNSDRSKPFASGGFGPCWLIA